MRQLGKEVGAEQTPSVGHMERGWKGGRREREKEAQRRADVYTHTHTHTHTEK
jgi:hypothetical protein